MKGLRRSRERGWQRRWKRRNGEV